MECVPGLSVYRLDVDMAIFLANVRSRRIDAWKKQAVGQLTSAAHGHRPEEVLERVPLPPDRYNLAIGRASGNLPAHATPRSAPAAVRHIALVALPARRAAEPMGCR